jgi:hypothetical protein
LVVSLLRSAFRPTLRQRYDISRSEAWLLCKRFETLSKEISAMDQSYYDFTTKMENESVNADYIEGWQSGYILNPPREEQHTTEAYEAGYEDGKARNTENFSNWADK